jgi:uncharacterized membrane protein
MSSTADTLINDYLDRLESELAGFPSERRRELVQEIAEHISEARASLEVESEAEILNLLERLGDPAEIAAEARSPEQAADPPASVVVERRSTGLDIAALVLLLVGGVVLPVIGWIVGVALLWVSSTWTVGQKLLGTLVVPGGLALPLGLAVLATSSATCVQVPVAGAPNPVACTSGGSNGETVGTVFVILLAVASVVTIAYLARRMSRNAGAFAAQASSS